MEEPTLSVVSPIFECKDVSFFYPEQADPTLSHLNLTISPGEFIVLCGPSGCGKSTLLRQLKTTMAPHGHCLGQILFEQQPLQEVDHRTQSQRIGFVQQSPENQVVTDKVWHELAFGLESLGYDTPTIRRRVAEMASFFGIQTWFYQEVSQLSGGQKQLLNLASIMAMQPSVLILDEPTSQLDPIAAADFLATLGKLNRELGTTILLTEHRLEEAFPLASRVVVMDEGRLIAQGSPQSVGTILKDQGHGMFLAMPTPMRVWAAVDHTLDCPVTVAQGRHWLNQLALTQDFLPVPPEPSHHYDDQVVLSAQGVWFRYEKNSPDVVKGLDLQVRKGEFLAILGGNGTGKTTTLKLLAGLQKPHRGSTTLVGKVGLLPQNPQTMFVKHTVREDLYQVFQSQSIPSVAQDALVAYGVQVCQLEPLLDRHPYDLSGGEQQRVALCKVLLLQPDILLMDEPTKGLDAEFKQTFATLLQSLLAQNITILMISHDVEFCASYAHQCALFFDGSIVTQGSPRHFFDSNTFYTTASSRMSRGLIPSGVTPQDIIVACHGQLPPSVELPQEEHPLPPPKIDASRESNTLPLWRKLLAILSAGLSIALIGRAIRVTDLSQLITAQGVTQIGFGSLSESFLLICALVVFGLSVTRQSQKPPTPVSLAKSERHLSKRTMVATGMILLLIPLTLYLGVHILEGRKYYFIALLILLECMAPFFLIFEGRKPQARELVVIAVLCAIAVAGRAALFMLPQFKPVTALCIIAGVAFGGETGFLVGAMTMLTSNILLGQGPWTPWQMFAMGIIGFLAGILFRKGWLGRSRLALCTYGSLACIIIYGGIMNPAFALLSASEMSVSLIASYLISGLPMDIIHALATVLFLWYGGLPMLEKLDRIKVKYGLLSR